MKSSKPSLIISKYSLLLALLILTVSLAKAFFLPADEVLYENRPANQFMDFSLDNYEKEEFQNRFEDALSDQVPFSSYAKKLYNIFDTRLALPVIRMMENISGTYVQFRQVCFFKDMLVTRQYPLESSKQAIDDAARKINGFRNMCEDVDLYVYYIETDHDIDLKTGQKNGCFEYFTKQLEIEGKSARLEIASFEAYHDLFMKTDHHWNYKGAYKAYSDICSMMNVRPLTPVEEHVVPDCYLGTRAAGVEGVPKEDFGIMVYDFPKMSVRISGLTESEDFGNQQGFEDGSLTGISYGAVYGTDYGEVVFDTHNPGENLLVLGDSFDNAIIKALASGFSKTYSVDLRAFETDTGNVFDYQKYIEDNSIGKVIIICNLDYLLNYYL